MKIEIVYTYVPAAEWESAKEGEGKRMRMTVPTGSPAAARRHLLARAQANGRYITGIHSLRVVEDAPKVEVTLKGEDKFSDALRAAMGDES